MASFYRSQLKCKLIRDSRGAKSLRIVSTLFCQRLNEANGDFGLRSCHTLVERYVIPLVKILNTHTASSMLRQNTVAF